MSERYYLHPLGHRVPSVTTITSQLDKSSALIQWAVNCACDYLIYNLNNNESLWQYPFEAGIDEENGACYIKKSHLFPLIEKARKEYKKISHTRIHWTNGFRIRASEHRDDSAGGSGRDWN